MIARDLIRPIRLSTIAAAITFVLIVVRALRSADPYWDTLAYHWAFSARVAGLCDRECFAFPAIMEARYDGFPLVIHALQGWIWRIVGTPVAGDLVNIAAVGALCFYARWRFNVPVAWCWLALFAIPEVQIELTSSYIDVVGNAGVTIALLVALHLFVAPEADHRIDIAIALASVGLAAGGKFLLMPACLLAWSAIALLAVRRRHADFPGTSRRLVFAVLALAGVIVILPKLAANSLQFGNPFYPIGFDAGPLHFIGPESAHQPNTTSSAWIGTPSPIRWLASIVEYDAYRGRALPWLIGQGDVPATSPSFRMGGYFVAYVLGALALIAWGARAASRAISVAALVAVLSLLCMALPSSSELRYYMFWMMTLVCLVLASAYSPLFASADQPYRRRAAQALVGIAAASVVSMTGATYVRTGVRAGAVTLAELVSSTNVLIDQVSDGATLCIRNFDRRAFLYAQVFHPGRHYRTRQLYGDEPDDSCSLRVTLPN